MELKLYLFLCRIVVILLLIVPYGIETTQLRKGYNSFNTFNRTLWN